MIWFLYTELGQAILATGDNPQMITSLGVNTHHIIILGVGMSNGLVALIGALCAVLTVPDRLLEPPRRPRSCTRSRSRAGATEE